MHPRTTLGRTVVSVLLTLGGMGAAAPATAAIADVDPTRPLDPPPIIPLPAPRAFVTIIDNPYSPFIPGSRWVYAGGTAQAPERIVVKVLHRTKRIQGITATVVRDTVTVKGKLLEDTFDWYAQDRRGRVWYLGEATREYEDGEVVSTEGSWEAGVDGARAGIIMVERPRVGVLFRQEYYAGHAEDQARFLILDTQVATASGVYRRVRMTEDTTPLDPSITEIKFYAPGVGLVLEFDLAPEAGRTELVRHRPARRSPALRVSSKE